MITPPNQASSKALSEVVHMVIQDKWAFLHPEKKNAAQTQDIRGKLLNFYRVLEVAEMLIKYSVYF